MHFYFSGGFSDCVLCLQLLQYGSTAVLWEPDLLRVIDTVERSGIKELNHEAARALRLLLAQVSRVHKYCEDSDRIQTGGTVIDRHFLTVERSPQSSSASSASRNIQFIASGCFT